MIPLLVAIGPRFAAGAWERPIKGFSPRFVTAMAWDPVRKVAWIGTETQGVWEYNPAASGAARFTQYTTGDGLGDNSCYAIAVDNKDRVWAGTDRHGVDVLVSRKESWRNYDVLPLAAPPGGKLPKAGPMASHIQAIAINPRNGHVWMGTEDGISIYGGKSGGWRYLAAARTLPISAATSICFAGRRRVLVASAAHGVALGTRNGAAWRWRLLPHHRRVPRAAAGGGLPSALVNCVFCVGKRNVYCGTDAGMAASNDGGLRWHFAQGTDFPALAGIARPGGRRPALLPEDYVTSLSATPDGLVWLGFRRKAWGAINPGTGKGFFLADRAKLRLGQHFVSAMLTTPHGVLLGHYGSGLSIVKTSKIRRIATALRVKSVKHPPVRMAAIGYGGAFPAANVPTVAILRSMLRHLCSLHRAPGGGPRAFALPDDWKTRGDWVGNVGRLTAYVGAMDQPFDQAWTHPYFSSNYQCFVDPAIRPTETIRRWISPASEWSSQRTLQDIQDGGRKQSSWDDHGEAYPLDGHGPDMYFSLLLPAGHFVLSFYFINDVGHGGLSRLRDYTLQLRYTKFSRSGYFMAEKHQLAAVRLFDRSRVLAIGRVKQFWPGVYKRFFLRLPGKGSQCVTMRVGRNASFNTIMSAIFIDQIGRRPRVMGFKPFVRPRWEFQSYRRWQAHPIPRRELKARIRVWTEDIRSQQPGGAMGPSQTESAHDVPLSLFRRRDCRHPLPQSAMLCQHLMQQILHLRRVRQAWFSRQGKYYVIEMLRFLFAHRTGAAKEPLAALLSKRAHALFSRRYVASLMRDFGLAREANHVWFGPNRFHQYAWRFAKRLHAHPPANNGLWWKAFNAWTVKEQKKEIQW